MKNKASLLAVLILLLVPLVSACDAHITRNADGSFSVQTVVSQTELQQTITASLADPLVKDVTVTLQQGYVDVSGHRQRLNDPSKTDAMSFRLDLSAQGGHLLAVVSGAQIDGVPVEQNRVDNWNQTIANRLERFAQRRPNTTLESVSITPAGVTMDWRLSK